MRRAMPEDAALLFKVCRDSYVQSFADHWNEGGLDWYLEKVYGREVIENELRSEKTRYYLSRYERVPAGFMKIWPGRGLHGSSPDEMEIEKVYVLAAYKGRGLGKALLAEAKRLAREWSVKRLWLDVMDTNQNAIAFYLREGFVFYDKVRLDLPYFRDELRGMHRMAFTIDR